MGHLAVLTPSYRPDFDSLLELHRSVLRHTNTDVVHHVVVPDSDVELLSSHASERLRVHSIRSFVPRSFLSTYLATQLLRNSPMGGRVAKIQAVNLVRPWPPIRGWILQQIAKLAAAAQLDADVVLVADSDTALIRATAAADFTVGDSVEMLRVADGVSPDMADHRSWHDAADRLLGLRQGPRGWTVDYVAPFLAWDPAVVRAVQGRITEVTGRDWRTALGATYTFSECILYGRYVDALGSVAQKQNITSVPKAHTYWETSPLGPSEVDEFVDRMDAHAFAVHLQSVSRTSPSVRDRVITLAEQRARTDRP